MVGFWLARALINDLTYSALPFLKLGELSILI